MPSLPPACHFSNRDLSMASVQETVQPSQTVLCSFHQNRNLRETSNGKPARPYRRYPICLAFFTPGPQPSTTLFLGGGVVLVFDPTENNNLFGRSRQTNPRQVSSRPRSPRAVHDVGLPSRILAPVLPSHKRSPVAMGGKGTLF